MTLTNTNTISFNTVPDNQPSVFKIRYRVHNNPNTIKLSQSFLQKKKVLNFGCYTSVWYNYRATGK